MRIKNFWFCCVLMGAPLVASPAAGQETTTYTYDALGRLERSNQAGGPANGTTTTFTYDNAGNRTNVKVEGASTSAGGDPGAGAGSPQTGFVVVPLNGYTLIFFKK